MIPTVLRHASGCSTAKRPTKSAGTGVNVWTCPGCGAVASSSGSA